MSEKRKLITLRVDEDMWERFKKIAKAKDSDAAKEMRKLIRRYVAENSQMLVEAMIKD